MSVGYVIPEVSREKVLDIVQLDDDIIVQDNGDDYIISMVIDPNYSIRKRVGLAKMVNTPPDNVQQGSNKAQVFLTKAPDEINSWFWGTAVSVNHPELVMDRIADLLDNTGIDAYWLSEHDEGYFDLT